MEPTKRAVIFFEEEIPSGGAPLALETLGGEPVLFWMGRELLRQGVERVFIAAPGTWDQAVRTCFPAGTAVCVSDKHQDLMDFLDTEEDVAVLVRPAVPFASAGPGFAYAAPGASLAASWRVKMTNALQDARLLSGWVPLYGRDTLAEIAPVFQGTP